MSLGKAISKNQSGRRHHRKSIPVSATGSGSEGVLEDLPPMLPCRGKLFIRYIWLPQNHMQHESYQITSDLTTPSSSCGKAEREKSIGHSMTHWISIKCPWSPSNQIKTPSDSPLHRPPSLSSLITKITLQRKLKSLTSRCVWLFF